MNLENLKIANTSLDECLFQINNLASQESCFIDAIPDFLKQDFNSFLVGRSLSTFQDRSITYDMKEYYHKIINKGFDYPIKWKM